MRILLPFLLIPLGFGQTSPQDLTGAGFRKWIKEQFHTNIYQALTYSDARRAMYNFIDNRDGSVMGVYGGFVKAVPFGGDITSPAPINTEHTVPQSFFGRQEPMRSDIHNLYPTYDQFNNSRANFPFGEIPDDQTEKWMLGATTRAGKPTDDIDSYSEVVDGRFEPREDHKGNVARSVFYFYTMYPDYVITRVGDINLFYAWHLADPVDDTELVRNEAIASFQGSRNPYIDHPDWVIRAWDEISQEEVNKILIAMGKEAVPIEPVNPEEPANEVLTQRLTVLADEWEQTILTQQRILQELRATIEQIKNGDSPR